MNRRVALVTGCAGRHGIGAATARSLAAAGIAVVVTDLQGSGKAGTAGPDADWQGLASLVSEIAGQGGSASALHGDVTSEADTGRMVQETLALHERLDILVNNAGSPLGADRADIEEVPLDAWEKVMAINLRGTFLMSRAAVAPMRRARWGRIINIASTAGLFGGARSTAYAASKAGIMGFSRALAMDVSAWNITVNCVCPGLTLTDRSLSGLRKLGYADDIEKGMAERSRTVPLGRYGTPEEVGATVAYLASDAAAYMTGQSLVLDGGKGSSQPPRAGGS